VLPRTFFARPTLDVARSLLGMRLVHLDQGVRLAGIIRETEAYIGEEDNACHARAGRTPRTAVMYGPPGHAYVYLNYGLHWLLNFVTEADGFPAAVLIRAIEPTEGLDWISARQGGRAPKDWANGPGKVSQSLGINGALQGADLCSPGVRLFIEAGTPFPENRVTTTPRVGLNKVSEPWKSIHWRFVVKGERDKELGIRN